MNKILQYFSLKHFAVVVLICYCTHHAPIEGTPFSWLKIALSVVCALTFFVRVRGISKAVWWAILILGAMMYSISRHPETLRWSTVLYTFSLFGVFLCYYDIVCVKRLWSLHFYFTLVRRLLIVLAVVLVAQQVLLTLGIRFFAPLNMFRTFDRGLGCNSLELEPSVLGRYMNVLFYVYIQCQSMLQGGRFSYRQLLSRDHKWVTIAYAWSILTMGSGTAFIGAGIVALYFVNWKNIIFLGPALFGMLYIGQQMGNESFQRAYRAAELTAQGNMGQIGAEDSSANVRLSLYLNTVNNFDSSNIDHWWGYGVDANQKSGPMGHTVYEDFGMVGYLLILGFLFSCCYHFLSLQPLLYFTGSAGMVGNIAYLWGLLMLLSTLRYFKECERRDDIWYGDDEDEDEEEDQEPQNDQLQWN